MPVTPYLAPECPTPSMADPRTSSDPQDVFFPRHIIPPFPAPNNLWTLSFLNPQDPSAPFDPSGFLTSHDLSPGLTLEPDVARPGHKGPSSQDHGTLVPSRVRELQGRESDRDRGGREVRG